MKLYVLLALTAFGSFANATNATFFCGEGTQVSKFDFTRSAAQDMSLTSGECQLILDNSYAPRELKTFVRFVPTISSGFCKVGFGSDQLMGRIAIDSDFLNGRILKTVARQTWSSDGEVREGKVACWY